MITIWILWLLTSACPTPLLAFADEFVCGDAVLQVRRELGDGVVVYCEEVRFHDDRAAKMKP